MKSSGPASRSSATALDAAIGHHQAGRLDVALSHYRTLRQRDPRDARIWHLGGLASLQQGRAAEAVEWLRGAVKLSPTSSPSWMCLGVSLLREGKLAEAESSLRRATQLAPADGEAWTNLGLTLARIGKRDDSLAALRRGAESRPKDPAGWITYAQSLLSIGRPMDALTALARSPAAAGAAGGALHSARAAALHALGRMADAAAEFDRALAADPTNLVAASQRLLVRHYLDDPSAVSIATEHREFGRALRDRLGPVQYTPAARAAIAPPARALRVGFLSPDLRDHAVACFLAPLLAHLGAEGLVIFLYHNHTTEDAVSAKLRAHATSWKNITQLTDDATVALIRADALDVLFDLAGHTGQARPAVFARRAAPVQITYLGYPNGTGIDTMDYRFTDSIVDPAPTADAWHVEKLVRFSDCAWCYAPPTEMPTATPPPASIDTSRTFTFGSFNHLGKTSPATWKLWARVLAAVPGSRLVLKGSEPESNWIKNHTAEAGIPADRVTLLPFTPDRADHFRAYAEMDVALDPLPYNGTTTTCEALWMGRPVITLAGDRHVRRVGASLLHAIGAPEWIAQSEDDYVAIAVALAADRATLGARCATLRQIAETSLLGNAATQSAAFASAIRSCVNQSTNA